MVSKNPSIYLGEIQGSGIPRMVRIPESQGRSPFKSKGGQVEGLFSCAPGLVYMLENP